MTVRRRRRLAAAVPAAAWLLAALAIAAVPRPTWPPPRDVGEPAALAAARAWLERCAQARVAAPVDCPERSVDPVGTRTLDFAWSVDPERAPMPAARVTWSTTSALYIVAGAFVFDYDHRRREPDGSVRHYAGDFQGLFSVALRAIRDRRDFGSLTTPPRRPTIDGFVIVAVSTYELPCCPDWALRTAG